MLFDSCRNTRAPKRFPASSGGALVNPPMARIAFGGEERKSLRDARYERMNPAKKASDWPRLRPTAGRVEISIPEMDLTASWSTSFGEIRSETRQFADLNCSATAKPGNRCPPVPPHAIATPVSYT